MHDQSPALCFDFFSEHVPGRCVSAVLPINRPGVIQTISHGQELKPVFSHESSCLGSMGL